MYHVKLTKEALLIGFEKCCITNSKNGNEDDILV